MNKLKEKIFDMSNSQLPLDKFYNDILYNTDINYDKVNAFKDLERIADYIINMQKDNAKLICKVDNFNNERLEMLDDIMELLKNNMKHFAEMVYEIKDKTNYNLYQLQCLIDESIDELNDEIKNSLISDLKN